MGIGNGIAIAGVWIFAAVIWNSKQTKSEAAVVCTLVAIIVTGWLK
jgi:hypothetical protein